MKHVLKRRLSALFARVDRASVVDKKAMLNRFVKVRNSRVGRYSYIGPRTTLDDTEVGFYCSISWDCCIGLASHPSNLISTSPLFFEAHNGTGTQWLDHDTVQPQMGRTVIGSDVWIGACCLIMAGTEIGHGAIIAAGSVVTKDVPPYAIVGGVPAKVIKYRFPPEVIDQLLEIQWWNAPEELLRSSIAKFSIPNPGMDVLESLFAGPARDPEV